MNKLFIRSRSVWKSVQTLYQVPEGMEKSSNTLSGPGGPGKAFKRVIRSRKACKSVQTLYQVPEGLDIVQTLYQVPEGLGNRAKA